MQKADTKFDEWEYVEWVPRVSERHGHRRGSVHTTCPHRPWYIHRICFAPPLMRIDKVKKRTGIKQFPLNEMDSSGGRTCGIWLSSEPRGDKNLSSVTVFLGSPSLARGSGWHHVPTFPSTLGGAHSALSTQGSVNPRSHFSNKNPYGKYHEHQPTIINIEELITNTEDISSHHILPIWLTRDI